MHHPSMQPRLRTIRPPRRCPGTDLPSASPVVRCESAVTRCEIVSARRPLAPVGRLAYETPFL
nr:hypothetical protein WS71_23570 [Burkholderia mayonis]